MPLTRAMLKRTYQQLPSTSGSGSSSYRDIEEGPLIEPNNHPLLNDLILSKVFEYMETKHLKSCRLVSKKWNILTIPFVRTRFKVTIYGHRSNPLIQGWPAREIRTIESFMELIHSNTLGLQLWNFVLGPFDPTVGIGQEFLSLFGNDMKSLELIVNCGVHTVEDISVILQSTQNLEHFGMPKGMCSKQDTESVVKLFPQVPPKLASLKTFNIFMEQPAGRKKYCPTLLEEFLSAAENISNLYLYDNDNPSSPPGVILEVFEVIENLGRESKLENLIISRVHPSHFIALQRMASHGLKLKHLRILHGQMPVHDLEPIPPWLQVIELFADTLITLGVSYGGSEWIVNELPPLPQLKILDVHIPTNGELRCKRGVNFMNTFPSLESLSMVCRNGPYKLGPPSEPPYLYGFFRGDDICPNMKILSLREGFDMTSYHTLERALKIFPNLYELELKIESAELLPQIWVHMSGLRLEKLHLYGDLKNEEIHKINMDSLFTGIPPEEILKIGDSKKYFRSLHLMSLEKRRQTLQTLVERHRTLPSISNLTSLRLLSLSIPGDWSSDARKAKYMTDLTGYLGIYFLTNLQELRLLSCAFSSTCAKILVKDIGLQSWNFRKRGWEEIEDHVRSIKKPYNGIRRNKVLEFDYAWTFKDPYTYTD